ncbi:hypothetical protein AB6A40_004900 [Gnathostoma spinigerum]|uniref:Uncharacterized protein n=1 Tax=Gnathostoma spinigerum TaxID=75299 RepID=A0ABD6EL98_9BILA
MKFRFVRFGGSDSRVDPTMSDAARHVGFVQPHQVLDDPALLNVLLYHVLKTINHEDRSIVDLHIVICYSSNEWGRSWFRAINLMRSQSSRVSSNCSDISGFIVPTRIIYCNYII